MMTPTEVFERLKALPEPLQGHNRRFIVEAISDETRAPMIEFYRQTDEAAEAAMAWAKTIGAEGFYPPDQGWGTQPRSVGVFSFEQDAAPGMPAWSNAPRGYVTRHGYVAKRPSSRVQGKEIKLPKYPAYHLAIGQLNKIDALRFRTGFKTVGTSDGKLHFTVPIQIGDRYFIDAVNHNYDIARAAQSAAEYLAGEHPDWAPDLDYEGDPLSWRPGPGWAYLTKTELEFLIAEENLRRARARAEAERAAA